MEDSLTLKWGTLKAWHISTEEQMECLKRYFEDPVSMSVMLQKDTPRQKQALCDLIDLVHGDIWLDWDDKIVSQEEAKKYVMEYKQ